MAKVALISFYDRICLSTRQLSSVLKRAGHDPFLCFLKDDRLATVDAFREDNVGYQLLFNNKRIGCNQDVNPLTDQELDLLCGELDAWGPDVVGISARTVSLGVAGRVVGRLRKAIPRALFIGGGYGPTILPEAFLAFLDFVCLGEGEEAILGMLDPETARRTPNVAWMEERRLRFNPLAAPLDLDGLPYQDWEPGGKVLIDDDTVRPVQERFDPRAYDVFSSRGCPANCSYCMASQWDRMYRVYGGRMPKVRRRSPRSVVDELRFAVDRYGIEFVRFKDSIFGYDRQWVFTFMDLYDQHVGLRFNALLDERFTREDVVERLAASGLDYTIVGIQSADEGIRRAVMQRSISDDGLLRYAEMVQRHGIKIKYDIIGWNPFETRETLTRGVELLKRLPKSNEIFVYQLGIFPGSPIFERLHRERPRMLSPAEYESWAWMYQLILRSRLGEELAVEALADPSYRENPEAVRALVQRAIREDDKMVCLVAARDIAPGEVITNIRITWRELQDPAGDAVAFDDKAGVLNRVAQGYIPAGSVIRYRDLFGAYENVGAGRF